MMRFVEGTSPLHRADARAKLCALAAFLATTVIFKTPPAALAATTASIAFLAVSGVPARRAWRDVRALAAVALIPLAVQAFAYPGATPYSLGPVRVTAEGIAFGALNAILLANALLAVSVLMYTTREPDLAGALRWFRLPRDVVASFALSLRFIPVIERELAAVRVAQAVRGERFSRPQAAFSLLVPVLHKLFRRARDVSIALEVRGFPPA